MFETENKEKHRANLAGNNAIVAIPTVNASVKLNPLTNVNAMLHAMRSRSRLCNADIVSFAALVVAMLSLKAENFRRAKGCCASVNWWLTPTAVR